MQLMLLATPSGDRDAVADARPQHDDGSGDADVDDDDVSDEFLRHIAVRLRRKATLAGRTLDRPRRCPCSVSTTCTKPGL